MWAAPRKSTQWRPTVSQQRGVDRGQTGSVNCWLTSLMTARMLSSLAKRSSCGAPPPPIMLVICRTGKGVQNGAIDSEEYQLTGKLDQWSTSTSNRLSSSPA